MRTFSFCLAVGILALLAPSLQSEPAYTGSNATGLFKLSGTVNLMQVSQADASSLRAQGGARALLRGLGAAQLRNPSSLEFPKQLPTHARPSYFQMLGARANRAELGAESLNQAAVHSLTVVSGSSFYFNGLTHLDQRQANQGNQFSVEPPNPSIAVGNGYVLEGVNNAVQVYNAAGKPLLPAVVATNELFGLPPALDRSTSIYGPFPTDMRVFYDPDIQRWFVLQRAQDEDTYGDTLASSHLYLAVSATPDPTGKYNVYTADTTDLHNLNCPCIDDYPQIGADRYGFYISSNQMNSDSEMFADVEILAISKAGLGSGTEAPAVSRFVLDLTTGYEFTMQPAITPPGASYFLANGGVEYFASTVASSEAGNTVAVWAMSNTSSLNTANPDVKIAQTVIPTLSYGMPNFAWQPDGPRPYGSSLTPPGPLEYIDGGDTRALSLTYTGGRLFLTFSTSVLDQNNSRVVGGALVVISPTIRNGALAAKVVNQNYLVVNGNNLLRPSVAVNPSGVGEVAVTLVGTGWYPSAAFIPISALGTPSTLHVAAAGTAPEDGFTGYTGGEQVGIARWGDYSTAVAASDGSIWMVTEYIGNLPRTSAANWDTVIAHANP